MSERTPGMNGLISSNLQWLCCSWTFLHYTICPLLVSLHIVGRHTPIRNDYSHSPGISLSPVKPATATIAPAKPIIPFSIPLLGCSTKCLATTVLYKKRFELPAPGHSPLSIIGRRWSVTNEEIFHNSNAQEWRTVNSHKPQSATNGICSSINAKSTVCWTRKCYPQNRVGGLNRSTSYKKR